MRAGPRPRRATSALVALVALVFVASGLAPGTSVVASDELPISPINASNNPPLATYKVDIHPDILEAGTELSFRWELTPDPREPECMNFWYDGPQAFWRHANEDGCTHPGPEHEGTITVRATDGQIDEHGEAEGGTWVCDGTYPHGSKPGVGPEPECEFDEDDSTSPDDPTPGAPEICEIRDVAGRLAPTQAVWQDDERFPPQPGKQLTWESDTSALAELPMVSGKSTVIVGVREYWNKPRSPDDEGRDKVVLSGWTRGQTPVDAHVEFRIEGVDASPDRFSEPANERPPLGAPCGDWRVFNVTVHARRGLLAPPELGFRFTGTGNYTITAELVSPNGAPYGVSASVRGRVDSTLMPGVLFAAGGFTPQDNEGVQTTKRHRGMALKVSRRHIPHYWPLKTGPSSFAGKSNSRYTDFSVLPDDLVIHRIFIEEEEDWDRLFDTLDIPQDERTRAKFGFLLDNHMHKVLPRRVDGLQQHRTVLVIPDADMETLYGSDTAGFAHSRDLVVIAQSLSSLHFLVAHELTHTIPFLWSTLQMVAECGEDFHNTADAEPPGPPVAYGMEVTGPLGEPREVVHAGHSYMSAARARWIDQCTYRNLLKEFTPAPPPPAPRAASVQLHVQGWFAKVGHEIEGGLLPAYTLSAVEEPPPLSAGADHAIVLRSTAGTELARYPFAPEFGGGGAHGGSQVERRLIHFHYKVPRASGTGRIQLEGPSGVLDELQVTPNAPTVTPLEPDDGVVLPPSTRSLNVRWEGSDPDGDPLVYTLLHTMEDGETWYPVVVDTTSTSHTIDVPQGFGQRLRLIATDGVNSDEAEIGFSVNVPVKTSTSIRYQPARERFRGKVQAEDPCAAGRLVVVKKRQPGKDATVGRARSRPTGAWVLPAPAEPGSYYAEVRRRSFKDLEPPVICQAGKSKRINVRGPLA